MKLRIVGSGDAFNAAGRGHACAWLEGLAPAPFMVDFGASALMQLQAQGLDHGDLSGLALTHLHGDHIGGLPFLWIDWLYRRPRSAPFAILGPPGVEERVRTLVAAVYGDVADEALPFELHWTEIAPGESREWLGLEVRAWNSEHQDPPEVALGFSITAGQRRVVFSGDAILNDALLESLQGAHLALVECTALEPPAGRHCTWSEWRPRLGDLSVGSLVLTHLGEGMREHLDDLRASVPERPRVVFAEDGDEIDIVD